MHVVVYDETDVNVCTRDCWRAETSVCDVTSYANM
jgi:hypothetical protein